ncbi:MAG: hypothetical protein D8M57_06260 [Candidatus Scalindua sp. AMX11]|nr:MAG: hypothetical protein DWQ00_14135 [Candidatus Scalindua sp.]TDE65691.1 MAG: hypothetical protein D8M57_06260 [Candidatus Scalindua sp. AMX11]
MNYEEKFDDSIGIYPSPLRLCARNLSIFMNHLRLYSSLDFCYKGDQKRKKLTSVQEKQALLQK